MNINPGELNKRITIVRRDTVEDSDGFESEIIEEVRTCWAKFTRKSIKQISESYNEMDLINARFVIRYTTEDIQQGMFVQYNGQFYHIEYVNEYADSHEYIEIGCKEGIDNV